MLSPEMLSPEILGFAFRPSFVVAPRPGTSPPSSLLLCILICDLLPPFSPSLSLQSQPCMLFLSFLFHLLFSVASARGLGLDVCACALGA